VSQPRAKPLSAGYACNGMQLRPLQAGDLATTLAWRNREGVRQRFATTGIIAPDAHRRWFESYLAKPDDVVFIASETAGGPPVGQLAIYDIDTGTGQAEIGRFLVAPEFAGQGKMRCALECLVRAARDELQLRRLILSVREDNDRAVALYRGLGFSENMRQDGMIFMFLDLPS
jgi:RimJ/RimL family protein N-acetyltransferase